MCHKVGALPPRTRVLKEQVPKLEEVNKPADGMICALDPPEVTAGAPNDLSVPSLCPCHVPRQAWGLVLNGHLKNSAATGDVSGA